ncbi:tripartite tricarboxylate transporter substrate binding protein [Siccirubricoccus sp. KC 17139]|uniref:Tripartite tricarboxylate transporter substrate binding protein n=2 Tax=Siccirubricoccus soli TaxID=2899147 RepID=A0ABT1D6B2_9PROT|nr:tripartite tricarboxylate transporter substrate binding protein [Siccirubricoccus soli]MCO6417457.1 tripartite tricarboxylate transporter substrate binding protein [Siccirubricoccus soli]MCP2683592.1 tripartite tricarboxylate transporter substrate binding protein [Siccirubricoccus soli]
MRIARRPLLAALALSPLALPALARAQTAWPSRPVTLIVPYPPGGSSDNVARPIQLPLSAALGQNIVIENRGGAGGSIGAAAVAPAKPDGYTLLVWPTAVLTISPHMMRLPYDPAKDFTPIAMLAASDGVMAMHPRVPVRTMPEFLAYARANPGKLRFSSAGNGTITQMTGEIFADAAGIRLEHVPYRGSAPAFTALLAGEVELQFDPVAIPAVKDGRVIGLATTGETRSPELPELPTLRELGLFGQGGISFFGLAGPAGLPVEVVDRLVAALGPVLALPEVARAMAPVGLRPRLEAGEAFAQRIAQDRAIFGDMVRRTGARAE